MSLSKLLGSKKTRSITVVSVLYQAGRAIQRGQRTRAAIWLGVAVLAWKWAIIGLAAQGALSIVRGGQKQPAPA